MDTRSDSLNPPPSVSTPQIGDILSETKCDSSTQPAAGNGLNPKEHSDEQIPRTHLLIDIISRACDLLTQLEITPEEEERIEQDAHRELLRRLPDFAKMIVLAMLLPTIAERTKAKLCKKGISIEDAEDLSGDLNLKILNELFGWPRENVFGWVEKIESRLISDHWRNHFKVRLGFGNRKDSSELDLCEARAEEEEWNRQLAELPAKTRQIVELRRSGESWESIMQQLQITAADITDALQPILGPLGFSSPPNSRRRKL